MKTNVSTKVEKIDLKTILDNYREPEFWNKEWTIIKTSQVEIAWKMTYISIISGTISSEVVAKRVNIVIDDEIVHSQWGLTENESLQSIPFNNPEYTETHFMNNLYGAVKRLLINIEDHCIYYYDDYEEWERLRDEFMDSIRVEAIEYSKQKGIDADMQDAFVDAYIDNHSGDFKYVGYSIDILDHYRYHIIPDVYKYAAQWFDKQGDYDNYCSMDLTVKGPHTREVIL